MSAPEQRHERLRALFLEAAALPKHERDTCIRNGSRGDAALEADVRRLLEHDSTSGGDELLDAPLMASRVLPRNLMSGPLDIDLKPGTRLGHYTVESLLGVGGMGVVYRARQDRPDRIVALKVIQPMMATPGMLRRIELEAELLGRLHHPGIAQIYEAGRFDSPAPSAGSANISRPFFAMEFIDGPNLTEYAARNGLDARARINLMRRICEAVQHAHQKGVIHRDLKPGNILVDPAGQPKVVDFGVAVASDAEVRLTTMNDAAKLIGTVPYMSPEQLAGDPGMIDTRSDVYSLGVVLYELLAGRLPHDFQSRSIPDIARIVREEPHAPLGSIERTLKGDLDVVIARALAKDPARRYPSAGALADDLARYLEGRPILARADSVLYVLRKQMNRYRGIVAAACIASIGLSIATGIAIRERGHADAMRGVAEAETQRVLEKSEALRRQAYFANIGFASAALQEGEIGRVRRALAECPTDLRGWEWRYLSRRSDVSTARVSAFTDVLNIASADAKSVLCLHNEQGAVIVDPVTKSIRSHIALPAGACSAAMFPDGRLCYAAAGELAILGTDGALQKKWPCAQDATVRCITPDGQGILISYRGRVERIDCNEGKKLWTAEVALIQAVDISPDGSRVLVGEGMGTGRVVTLDAANGRVLRSFSAGNNGVRSLAWSQEGAKIAVGGVDGSVGVWDAAADGKALPLMRNRIHTNKVTALGWSPDGTRIATGSSDHLMHLMDVSTGDVVSTFAGHDRTIAAVSFVGPSSIVTASLDGTVRWWNPAEPGDGATGRVASSLFACDLSGDGKQLVAAGTGKRLYIADAETLHIGSFIPLACASATDVEVVDHGKSVAVACGDGIVNLYSLDTPKAPARQLLKAPSGVAGMCWSEHKNLLIIGQGDGIARAIKLESGSEAFTISVEKPLTAIAIDHKSMQIAMAEASGDIHVFDMESRREIARLLSGSHIQRQVMFSPDGKFVYGAGEDWLVRKWPAAGGTAAELKGHAGPVHSLALSPDGTRLVTGGFDNTVRLWDAHKGVELLLLPGHTGAVRGVCFSADGERIYSVSDVGLLKSWSAKN